MSSAASLALPARAKLNLSLAVTGRLDDGRHALVTRFQAISLHDLVVVGHATESTLHVAGAAPVGDDNLVVRALRELEAAAARPLPTQIRLLKRVPMGAGLGGGSSDAATALRAVAALHAVDLDLAAVAARLGSDVPFFLAGGAADGTGAGDRLTPAAPVGGWFAVAWPGFEVSTASVYTEYDRTGGAGENHLEAAAMRVEPRLAAFRERLGAGWRMTGSGSAFFKHFETRGEAESAISGIPCWTAVARPVGRWS